MIYFDKYSKTFFKSPHAIQQPLSHKYWNTTHIPVSGFTLMQEWKWANFYDSLSMLIFLRFEDVPCKMTHDHGLGCLIKCLFLSQIMHRAPCFCVKRSLFVCSFVCLFVFSQEKLLFVKFLLFLLLLLL